MTDDERDEEETVSMTFDEDKASSTDPPAFEASSTLDDSGGSDAADGEAPPSSQSGFEFGTPAVDEDSSLEADRNSRPGPLGDLASDVESRQDRSRAFDELFEREDVGEIDGDRLWEQLEAGAPEVELPDDAREQRVISKRTYCHQCEHFAKPPAVSCRLDGTEILEMPSVETFRVVDCPVVLEDEALEQ